MKDVNQQEFIMALAAFLKQSSGKMKVPEWVDLVKTNNRWVPTDIIFSSVFLPKWFSLCK